MMQLSWSLARQLVAIAVAPIPSSEVYKSISGTGVKLLLPNTEGRPAPIPSSRPSSSIASTGYSAPVSDVRFPHLIHLTTVSCAWPFGTALIIVIRIRFLGLRW